MPVAPVIDIDALLAPVSEESPVGSDPRGSVEWGELKQARQARGGHDPFGEAEPEPPDWDAVLRLGRRMLSEQGKHLEVACDIAEALVHKHGFPGLRDGLRLVREIQLRYWDSLYPVLETGDEQATEDSLLDRAGPLNGLNTNIVSAVNNIPVSKAAGDNFDWLLYNDSRYVENVGRKDPTARAQLIADGRPDPEVVDKAINATPWQFYETGVETLDEVSEELKGIDDLLDDKYAPLGNEGPSLQPLRGLVSECRTFFERLCRQKKPVEAGGEGEIAEAAGEAAMAAIPGAVPLAPRDRADAIRRLRAVADFFQRTEPHSPVAYLVQRAATWGEMSLEQWLREVVKDPTALGQIRETLGIVAETES